MLEGQRSLPKWGSVVSWSKFENCSTTAFRHDAYGSRDIFLGILHQKTAKVALPVNYMSAKIPVDA